MAMLSHLRQRILEPEIMDQPDLAGDRHDAALRGLARLNWWSGSVASLWSAMRGMVSPGRRPFRILDVASGAGDVLIGLGQRARRAGVSVDLVGGDISPRAIAHATDRAQAKGVQAEFVRLDALRDGLPKGFDCIVSSLFLHHLDDQQAVHLLSKMRDAATQAIMISDLVRSRRGLLLAHAAARLFTRSDVVHTDGPRSVRAACTIPEARQLAVQAGCEGAVIRRIWPCRFLLTWKRPI
jgi:SAM-dependent methyltransferase